MSSRHPDRRGAFAPSEPESRTRPAGVDRAMARATRRNPFAIRMTDAERAEAEARADRAGLSLGGFFKAAALDAKPPRSSRRPTVDQVELSRLMAQLGKIGSNVNQLAHQANAGSWPERRTLEDAAADVRWMRDSVMRALSITPPADFHP